MSTEFADRFTDGWAKPEHSKRVDPSQIQENLSTHFSISQIRAVYEKAKEKGWIVDAQRTTPGNRWQPSESNGIKIARKKAEAMDQERIEHESHP